MKKTAPLGLSLLLAVVLAAPALMACGGTRSYELVGTDRTVGTDANLEVAKDGANFKIKLDVENLPPPARVSESATTYLVWLRPEGQAILLLGQLNYDDDDREGHLETTTPHEVFELIVTAESDPAAASPNETVVLRQRVD
ncbi:MAG: hypothetical protein AAGH15_18755 [Myxococcota bacterium]